MHFVAEEVRQIMTELGFKRFTDMVGRVDRLQTRKAIEHFKAKSLDFSAIFHQPKNPQINLGAKYLAPQFIAGSKLINDNLDWQILEKAKETIEHNLLKGNLLFSIYNCKIINSQ